MADTDTMRLKVSHTTIYSYDHPVHYALQQLRLTPRSGHGQTVLEWKAEFTGGTRQVKFQDQYANTVDLVLMEEDGQRLEIRCEGVVETEDRAGVVGQQKGAAPLWLFASPTRLTQPGPGLRKLARGFGGGDTGNALDQLHALSAEIAGAIRYETGRTDAATTAEEALAAGHGVCQDHAHVMISAARLMGHPARYISGYLLLDGQVDQDAAHGWCEVWLENLGWVGFDVSNRISPDARYVRVAVGRDYTEAAPVHGLRQGTGSEDLQVQVQVQQ